MHNNCTTGVESYLLGKPAISYRPLCDPLFDLYLPNALSAEAFDLDTVMDLLVKTLQGGATQSAQRGATHAAIAGDYIENVAGRLACQRFLDALETKDIPEEPLGYAVGPVTNLKTALRKKLRPLKRAFKEKRVNSRLWTKESARRKRDHALRSDVLDKTEMGEFLKAAQRFTGSFRDIQIVELEKNLLCLFR